MKRWEVLYYLRRQQRKPDKRLAAIIDGRRQFLRSRLVRRPTRGKFQTETRLEVWVKYKDIFVVDLRAEAIENGLLSDDPAAANYHEHYRVSNWIFGPARWVHKEMNRTLVTHKIREIET